MTSAWVARKVSSELNTSTTNAGVRSATVRRSSTPKRRRADRRCVTRWSGSARGASRRGGATGATSVLISRCSGSSCRRARHCASFRVAPRRGGSDRAQLVAQVAAAAQVPLRLARRGLGQRPGSDEHDVLGGYPHRIGDARGDGGADGGRVVLL